MTGGTRQANAFVLYANYKRYHWQTFGPHFRDYHKMFDEFAHEVRESLDPLAERIRMIWQDPPAHLNRILELCSVTSSEEADANMHGRSGGCATSGARGTDSQEPGEERLPKKRPLHEHVECAFDDRC